VATSFATTPGCRCGRNQDAGGEADGLGDTAMKLSQMSGSGMSKALTTGHLAVGAVGVGRLVALGHENVLDRPQRFEAGLLSALGNRNRSLGCRERAGVGEDDSELHGPGT
jgi:hypothetical protein